MAPYEALFGRPCRLPLCWTEVVPKRGVVRFSKRGKLSPRFIGPFEILERIGTVAYRLPLRPSMIGVHEVFHVSMLRLEFRDEIPFKEGRM